MDRLVTEVKKRPERNLGPFLLPIDVIYQLIGDFPRRVSISFIAENGFEPRNPRWADKGLGCTPSILASSEKRGANSRAEFPQRRPSAPRRAHSATIDRVIGSHPIFEWDPLSPALTVSVLFRSTTP